MPNLWRHCYVTRSAREHFLGPSNMSSFDRYPKTRKKHFSFFLISRTVDLFWCSSRAVVPTEKKGKKKDKYSLSIKINFVYNWVIIFPNYSFRLFRSYHISPENILLIKYVTYLPHIVRTRLFDLFGNV